jgi:uncharacterized protein (DUF3820 family)
MKEKEETGAIDPQIIVQIARTRMPFGKYKDRLLCELPEPYLVWFYRKGFPSGKIGMLLAALYEIKLNGLEYLLKPVKEKPEETTNQTEN